MGDFFRKANPTILASDEILCIINIRGLVFKKNIFCKDAKIVFTSCSILFKTKHFKPLKLLGHITSRWINWILEKLWLLLIQVVIRGWFLHFCRWENKDQLYFRCNLLSFETKDFYWKEKLKSYQAFQEKLRFLFFE